MLRKLKILCWLAVIGGAAYGGWYAYQRYFVTESGTEHLVNQFWIERVAADERDQVHHFVLVDGNRGRAGVTGRASRWRVGADVFVWRLDGNLLRMRFPQDDKRLGLRVRTWRCAGQAPRPFELCLELQRNGRSARFYSRKDWVVKPGTAATGDPLLSTMEPALEALSRAPQDADPRVDGPEASPDVWPF